MRAGLLFLRFRGRAIGGVVAVLLASPRIISDGLQMPVRIRAEPAVHIGGRKADAVQPPDFFRVLDSPASRVEIGPADPMLFAGDPLPGVIDIAERRQRDRQSAV